MDPAKQAKVMREFQKQSAQMDMTVRSIKIHLSFISMNTQIVILTDAYGIQTEMMSDAIDDALDNDEAEDETEDLTNQVHFHVLPIGFNLKKQRLFQRFNKALSFTC